MFLWSISKRKTARLGARPLLSPEDFYRTYYQGSGLPSEVVIELRQEVADAVEIPPGLLRPSHRFSSELADAGFLRGIDGGLAELTFAAERREKRYGRTVDLANLKTLDDYIRAFGSLHPTRPIPSN